MRRHVMLVLLVVTAVFAGCTGQAPEKETGSTGRLTVGDSFLAARTTDGGIAPLERNIVRPGDRFLFVLRDVDGFERGGDGEYRFDVGVAIVEEPGGDEVYSKEDVGNEGNEAVMDGVLRFTDIGISTPPAIGYGTYSVRVTVHDEVGDRNVTAEESLIVSSADGEPS